VLIRSHVPLAGKKQLKNVGKNGFPPLSNVLGAEVFRCHINNFIIFDFNFDIVKLI
jgi:hypothetical protein